MQARLIFRSLARTLGCALCCGCVAGVPDVAPGTPDAGARGSDGQPGSRDANPPSSTIGFATDAGRPRDPKLDGATVAVDSGKLASPGDACAGDACTASAGCDADHPCGAPDSICVQAVCTPDPAAPPAAWLRSTWSGRVGLVDENDSTLWCTPVLPVADDARAPATVTSQLDRVALDGTQQHAVGATQVAQRVLLRCSADVALSGPSTQVSSAWSQDGAQDRVSVRCPGSHPFLALAQCQIAAEGKPPFVYAGPTCGDGVSGLAQTAEVHGQLIGDHYELSAPGKPLFNNTGRAAVMGSDLGFQFLAQGRMYIGFGDTWENELSVPAANGFRGSILAYTHDFEPADENGIAIEGWETAPDRPEIATEVVRSVHDQSGNTEFTAIATSGFGLSEGSDHYRFLWFAAIKKWDPFTNNESTLAWSKNGAAFTRGDRAPDAHPARWPFESFFGPGATWVDREHGYVYFFGVRTYQPGFPIRLARVRATVSAVLDHLQYEYWTGSAWVHPDPKDEYALARLADPAADLVPGSAQQNNRPELSVAYNPYVGRFTMLLQNDATPFKDEAQTSFELWESASLEGPWQRADSGEHLVLPPHLYGPYMSEQTLSDGGRDVFFALSDWNLQPLALGQPYVVGLWSARLERKLHRGCAP